MTGTDKRLAWDTGKVGTVAAHLSFFYNRYPFAQAVSRYGRNESADPGADNNYVVVVSIFHVPPSPYFKGLPCFGLRNKMNTQG
jgi:hypothetical protein